MLLEFEFRPPEIDFDDRMAEQLRRLPEAPRHRSSPPAQEVPARNSPFVDYARILTPDGGILILYRDCARGPIYTVLRIVGWCALTGVGAWLLAECDLSLLNQFVGLMVICAINLWCVTRPIKVRHSAEIRHDRMILDGKDVFWASDIGGNWPKLQMKDDDPNRMVICGICGTRFIEYMTANRMDSNDRTAEVLAADLQSAMEQLWGRSEVIFDQ